MSGAIDQRASLDFIRYASVWEDADILCEALQPAPGKKILSIASGGDNAFALLAEGAQVVAVDLNPMQLAVCELKKVAIAKLEYEEVLRFLGVLSGGLRLATYQKLKGDLSDAARELLEGQSEALIHGVIHAGKFERYFHTFRKRVLPCIHGQGKIDRLLDEKSMEAQKDYYDRHWDSWRWRALFRIFFSRTVMGRMGRDPEFFRYVEGSVADRILERTRYALTELPTSSNPYLRYILTGNFTNALPRYLRKEHFEGLRNNLHNLQLVQGPIDDVAAAEGGGFDGFNLSDIFEYLDETLSEQIYTALVEQSAPGARFAYWNMLVPRSLPESLSARVEPMDKRSAELFARDRAWFYSAFRVDEVKGAG